MVNAVAPQTPTSRERTSKGNDTASAITPPPSVRAEAASLNNARKDLGFNQKHQTASSPKQMAAMVLTGVESWRQPLPTLEQARALSEESVRRLVLDLIPFLSETRMELAHSRLQYHLLNIESREAAERAMVEHDMTRREVDVLRAGSPMMQSRAFLSPDPLSTTAQLQHHLEMAVSHGRRLEEENSQLHCRLKQAKKLIKHLDGQKEELSEDNLLLKERIRDNREHFNEIRAMSSNYPALDHASTSRTRTAASPKPTRTSRVILGSKGNQAAFDALLFAGQVLSDERKYESAPASRHQTMRPTGGHVRGTHSLSSMPSTPVPRQQASKYSDIPFTPEAQVIRDVHTSFSAPANQTMLPPIYPAYTDRTDRDSTISASEDERSASEDEIPASQASQVASNMLRRTTSRSLNMPAPKIAAPPSSHLVQSKLLGRVAKRGAALDIPDKAWSSDRIDGEKLSKKIRLEESERNRIGLGIDWLAIER